VLEFDLPYELLRSHTRCQHEWVCLLLVVFQLSLIPTLLWEQYMKSRSVGYVKSQFWFAVITEQVFSVWLHYFETIWLSSLLSLLAMVKWVIFYI